MVGDNIPKLAVLIDAENARSLVVSQLLSEIAKYGTAHAKRAYGIGLNLIYRAGRTSSLSNRSNQSSSSRIRTARMRPTQL
jgi:hypothetical protein